MSHVGPGRLHIHTDKPLSAVAEDEFGFVAYADAFALLINDAETATPLAIGISGPWGSGKTSLAKLVEFRLATEHYWWLDWDEPPATCWFNAWLHRDADHLGAAFLASITRDLSNQRPWWWRILRPVPTVLLSPRPRLRRRVWTAAVIASLALAISILALAYLPPLDDAEAPLANVVAQPEILSLWFALPAVIAFVRSFVRTADQVKTFIDEPASAAATGSLAQVRGELQGLVHQVQRTRRRRPGARRRIVIFVDDLERCPPEKALDMCEVANQLLDQEHVVTVFIADLELLESAAFTRFSAIRRVDNSLHVEDGRDFLHKMIQLRFNLPPLHAGAVAFALGLQDRNPHFFAPTPPLPAIEEKRSLWLYPIDALKAVLSGALTLRFSGAFGNRIRGDTWTAMSTAARNGFAIADIAKIISIMIAIVALVNYEGQWQVAGFSSGIFLIMVGSQFMYLENLRLQRRDKLRQSILRTLRQGSVDDANDDTERRLVLSQRVDRRKIERSIAEYVPTNPRRAKRLLNHHRLLATIAEDRGIFGGDPALTHRHLVKWILVTENWPGIGARLAREPSLISELEHASEPTDLANLIDGMGVVAGDTNELHSILQSGQALAPVLERLVRFEPAARKGR